MLPFLQATQSLGKLLSSPEIPFFDSSVIILVGKNSQRTPFTSIRICMKLRNTSIRICMKLRNKPIPLFSSRHVHPCSSIFNPFSSIFIHFQSIFNPFSRFFRKTAGPGPPNSSQACARWIAPGTFHRSWRIDPWWFAGTWAVMGPQTVP